MTRRGPFAGIQGTVCGYDQTNEEKVDNVEDGDTPDDLFRGPRDLLSRVGRFCSSQSGQLSARVGERGGDEDTAEAVEPIEECAVG